MDIRHAPQALTLPLGLVFHTWEGWEHVKKQFLFIPVTRTLADDAIVRHAGLENNLAADKPKAM